MNDLLSVPDKNGEIKKTILTIKLTIISFLISLLGVSASSYSQNTRLDISLNGGTMVDLIKQIEANSEFYFYYQKEELKELDQLNLEVSNATLMDVLGMALAGTSFKYNLLDKYIVIYKADKSNEALSSDRNLSFSQQSSISGKVVDANGHPLPGVTVVVKGTTLGTVTDAEGNY